jgi:hypothetical protein
LATSESVTAKQSSAVVVAIMFDLSSGRGCYLSHGIYRCC